MLISFFARILGSSAYLLAGNFYCGLTYYLLLCWTFGYKPDSLPDLRSFLGRYGHYLGLSACLVILYLVLLPPKMFVHFIDVGQGDAALFITPNK